MDIKLKISQIGFGLVGRLVALLIALIFLVIFTVGFYEGRKAYWDHRITKMCEEDGGIEIYETVQLDEYEYSLYVNKFGNFSIPRASDNKNHTSLISEDSSIYIRRNNPEIRKNKLTVIRRSDGKVLGSRVSYSRRGGDLIAPHPSIFRCPEKLENIFLAVVPQAMYK